MLNVKSLCLSFAILSIGAALYAGCSSEPGDGGGSVSSSSGMGGADPSTGPGGGMPPMMSVGSGGGMPPMMSGSGSGMGPGGGMGNPAPCMPGQTMMCCGDGACDGPETADNCAADCSGM